MARRRMYGSATCGMGMAVCVRTTAADLFERVLEREGVDDRAEHAGVVGRGAVHAGLG